MKINTSDATNNGYCIRAESRAQSGRPQPIPSGYRVGYSPANPPQVGAGSTHPSRAVSGQPSTTDCDHNVALAKEPARFDAILSDHEAEAEHQAFLAEAEAEHLIRDRQEESAYWGAQWRANHGEEVAI